MKIVISSIVLFMFITVISHSQQKRSCCEETSAPQRMALLGNDQSFRDAHPTPIAFTLTGGNGSMITFNTPDGKTANGYEVRSANTSDKWILVFHEWYGLNDYIKKECEELRDSLGNVNVLAIDLYDGKVASNNEEASKYVQSVDVIRAVNIIKGAADYAGSSAVLGTLGWCFGGAWSLQTAIELGSGVKACVMYYGMPEDSKDRLAKLQAPILGIFGKKDGHITPEIVSKFEDNMKSAGKTITVYSYDAVHAFANPSNPLHDPEATKDAKAKTLQFFRDNLK